MIPEKRPARLIGGPFDGDSGELVWKRNEAPPDRLWVFDCGGGRSCPLGGIHWCVILASIPGDVRISLYALDETHRDEAELPYVHDAVLEPGSLLDVREREPEPMVAFAPQPFMAPGDTFIVTETITVS